jgi:tryptophan synthase alpha chain
MSNRWRLSMIESGIDRLASLFAEARSQNRAVLLPYLTAGIPTVGDSVRIFEAMAVAGADGFEVGIPYADPLMDGPVIMEAGERALASGVTVDVALEVIRRVADSTGKPVLAMTYVNPVLRKGVTTFFDEVASAGASGVIIADLPAEEAEPYMAAARAARVGLALFVAPTTDETRLRSVLEADPAFVYAVAEVGVTGERDAASTNTEILAQRIREHSDAPIVFGVGISTPGQVRAAAEHGDGVIVGTAIVRRVLEASSADEAAEQLSAFVSALSASAHRKSA